MIGLAALAAKTESAELPDGDDERLVARRRFPASSIGPACTSVWHRAPTGDWTFWQDHPTLLSCRRYFSAAASTPTEAEIVVEWPSAHEMTVTIPGADLR